MLIRALTTLALLLLALTPTAAQETETDPLSWIPGDFAGYLRLRIDPDATLTTINIATFAASFLQPERVAMEPAQQLEAIIPLTQLDVEDASYVSDILPWLGDEIIIAYAQFGPDFSVQADDAVLILPTTDALQSASSLSRIFAEQDALAHETYGEYSLYLADKAAVVFTPGTVLIGPEALVKAMLDAEVGERLVDDPAYRRVAGDQHGVLSGYLNGREALSALSFLLQGDETAMPILEDIGLVLDTYTEQGGLEKLLLDNALDSVAFTLEADTIRLSSLRLSLTFYDASYSQPVTAEEFNVEVLNYLPQNAMIVHNGTDARTAAYDLLAVLPLANFASQVLGAFPVTESSGVTSGAVTVPDAAAMEQAIGGFLSALARNANYDLDHDLLQYFSGSYAVALLPRPNDPLPVLNASYEFLLVAEVDNEAAAFEGATSLVRLLLGQDELDTFTIADTEFAVVRVEDEPLLYVGTVDSLLLVAAGDVLERAMDARRGDNRLVNRERWQNVSQNTIPQLYVDIPAVYSTFRPQAGGAQVQEIRQISARTDYVGDGVFEMNILVTMPGRLS